MAEQNHMQVIFDAKSVNESLARMVVTAFMTDMNPTLEQVSDVKTAVSEAVTNAIIHGYENKEDSVELCCDRDGQQLIVTVEDHGVELRMLNGREILFIRQSRNWSVLVWDLLLWKPSWTRWKCVHSLAWERK